MDFQSQLEECINFYQAELIHCINKTELNSSYFSLTPINKIHSSKTTDHPSLPSYIWLPNEKSSSVKSLWWVKNKNEMWPRVLLQRNSDSNGK